MEAFTCGSLNPEPWVEHGFGSIAGHLEALLVTLGANVQHGLEPCHMSQGQTVVVRDIQGVGALLSGVGLTETSEDGPGVLPPGRPSVPLEGLI